MALPLSEPQIQAIDEELETLFSYEKMKIRINDIIDSWQNICKEAIVYRNTRYAKLDVEALRQSGDIAEDETFVPDRVIDTNIMREKPDAMAFLKQSNRLAIFKCLSDPRIQTKRLELEYTNGLTYKGWYREFDRAIDGASLFGWDIIEVVYDETKPLHVGFEHVGHDRLFFNRKVGNIQDSDIVVRKYEATALKLLSFKKTGFAADQIDTILSKDKDRKKVDEVQCIYKVFFKKDSVVYVAWYSQEGNVNNWLKAPEPLRIGIKELQQPLVPDLPIISDIVASQGGTQGPSLALQGPQWVDKNIDLYPLFLYLYKDDEQEQLTEHKGRGFLDEPQQEASTVLLTGSLNRLIRSSNVYASPATDDGDSAEIKQLDTQLEHGGIYNKPLNFFSVDPPDPSIFAAMQYLSTLNAQNTGKTSYAVSNRKDSRKTATELSQAEQKETEISSTTVAAESEWLREIFDFSWRIVQSQALQDKIPFLLRESAPDPLTGQAELANDKETIGQTYDVRPAGDVDVIERQQKELQYQQDWPVIQTTPLAATFLKDFLQLRYPDKAEEYTRILEEGDKGKALVASLSTLLKAFTSKEDLATLSPQEQAQLQQIQAEVMVYLGSGQQQQQQQQQP